MALEYILTSTRPDAGFDSGVYTPVADNFSGGNTATTYPAQWIRVGNIVSVTGKLDVTSTVPFSYLSFTLDLPYPTTFTGPQLNGTGNASGQGGAGVDSTMTIFGAASGTYASILWLSPPLITGNYTFTYTFMYEIQ